MRKKHFCLFFHRQDDDDDDVGWVCERGKPEVALVQEGMLKEKTSRGKSGSGFQVESLLIPSTLFGLFQVSLNFHFIAIS